MSKLSNVLNAAWYAVENVTAIVFGLISVIIVARIFGPENLGKLSFIQAISATAIFLVVLGLDHIIVRELAKNNTDYNLIFTTIIVQSSGWIIYSSIVLLSIWIINGGSIDISLIYISISVLIATYFSRATVVKLFFQAVNQPRKIAISAIISRASALIYLAYALNFNFDYHLVIIFIPIQSFIQFLILLLQFIKFNNLKHHKWQFDTIKAKCILKEALPLIGSSMLFPIFMQGDILLISAILDDTNTGIYSSASRLITQFIFIGHIITMTFYLTLSNKYFQQQSDYEEFVVGIIIILFTLGFGLSISVYAFSDIIIRTLYGYKFTGAENILEILCWNWMFIFPAALFSRMLVLQNLAKYEFIKSLFIATFSISMNYFFIERFGITGAAIVSILSYFLADFLIYALFKETRHIFKHAITAYLTLVSSPNKALKYALNTIGSK
ncbi:flippase [Aliivibrio sp. S2TY2]|uniref:flippase n=1 Tax=unclassified Aliivibrio TaxID=2645654 RepID=UPI002378079A|nr:MULTISPECIES: flippase [unclassified Aliivibrio]MDD9174990.1 flippase [Aliivibrio sp. S3TY1]MDD9192063.1 flippase [Aliivibrio sp. S2TY2]